MEWLKKVSEAFSGAIEQGNLVWWVLAALVFISAAAVVYEALAGAARAVAPAGLRAHIFEHLKHGRHMQALQEAQRSSAPFAAVARTVLRLPEDAASYMFYAAAEETVNREAALLRARVSVLGGLAVAALLVGTIGALGGMLAVLRSAAASVSAAVLAAEAAGGMKTAVAAGVLAALVAGFYYVFLVRLHLVEALLWSETQRLAATLLGTASEKPEPAAEAAGTSAAKGAEVEKADA